MIDYYFSLLSPWAYLGHATFIDLAKRYDLIVRYQPVFLSDVFQETGGLPLPKRHPARQRYRMLELQRWREKRALPLTLHPTYFPVDPRLADRVVIALIQSGDDPEHFIRDAFETVWVTNGNLADPDTLAAMLAKHGHAADRLLETAQSDEILALHHSYAQNAIAAGVIGSPCYVRQGEVFWGQDRLELLEDAIRSGREPYRSS